MERLRIAIRQLNDTDKAIMALYLEELSYGEIAAITGITENNVGVKINRIKTNYSNYYK
ncbi:RNA polymerase sigma factor [Chitinophaga pinensis]|uniref:RNA polymerase sigma factor n=1 Tax=Chitinophaga pinensis TaxID=79329 RepID=UPI0021BDCEC2|nr:sigma factor-like helix-turn-helix DNA-binding protein [Chitinophaga pinensis]